MFILFLCKYKDKTKERKISRNARKHLFFDTVVFLLIDITLNKVKHCHKIIVFIRHKKTLTQIYYVWWYRDSLLTKLNAHSDWISYDDTDRKMKNCSEFTSKKFFFCYTFIFFPIDTKIPLSTTFPEASFLITLNQIHTIVEFLFIYIWRKHQAK